MCVCVCRIAYLAWCRGRESESSAWAQLRPWEKSIDIDIDIYTDGLCTKGTRAHAQGNDPRVALGA